MNLPIDVISGTNPPKFRWQQTVQTPVGQRIADHEGMLQPSVEEAVVRLVKMTKQLLGVVAEQSAELQSLTAEIENLKKMNLAFADRLAAQSELLSKRAEAPAQTTQSSTSTLVSASSSREGKGRKEK